jgi:hypothetical protein
VLHVRKAFSFDVGATRAVRVMAELAGSSRLGRAGRSSASTRKDTFSLFIVRAVRSLVARETRASGGPLEPVPETMDRVGAASAWIAH